MFLVHADDVNQALADGMRKLSVFGERETSRNGDVLVLPAPCVTTYYNPHRRVLFGHKRDANPFFHLFESLWMLNGSNDLAFLERFNSKIGNYSDDGFTFWGAYGYRWRQFFGYDQLTRVVAELRRNPDSRRAVLTMWNGMQISGNDVLEGEVADDGYVAFNGGKDVPCNTHAYFDLRGGKLNMTVCNRSNDALWGCYGANAVHFSILLEYMAVKLSVDVGVYRQFSNNLHAYVATTNPDVIAADAEEWNYYEEGKQRGYLHKNLVDADETSELLDNDIAQFVKDPFNAGYVYSTRFMHNTVRPMALAWAQYKAKNYDGARILAFNVEAWDWRLACMEWFERRENNRLEKQA